ncbi:hypothetical protein ACFPYI_21855 [Halomarina salina]|uniref:Restriction endonuclease n=1 Tax=Halomarina salina TaxID=1872699 RepID=A0ABD5RUF9_9EURY|nr:hypothetical protein [Halomarina salina]
MSPTTRSALVDTVRSELIAYLGSGRPLNQDVLAGALGPSDLQIAELDRLLGIHFVQSDPVRAYMRALPERLRRIRTANNVSRERTRGEVRGAVDWGQTFRARYETTPRDRSMFVTRTPQKEYDLPENILVKKLLSTVVDIATNDLRGIDQQWRRDRWPDSRIDSFERTVRQNVHLGRIGADATTTTTDRQLRAARSARQPLYYEAYELYRLYESLLERQFEQTAAQSVLNEVVIAPETSRLFELACLFRLLSVLQRGIEATLHTIERGSERLATLRTDQWEIDVYHDDTGPFRLYEPVPPAPQDEYLNRYRSALDRHRRFLNRASMASLFEGRPDVLLVFRDRSGKSSRPTKVAIGEIKHTASTDTFSNGVKELATYLEFARLPSKDDWGDSEESYLTDRTDIDLHGFVLTDGVPLHDSADGIDHLNYDSIAADSIDWLQ